MIRLFTRLLPSILALCLLSACGAPATTELSAAAVAPTLVPVTPAAAAHPTLTMNLTSHEYDRRGIIQNPARKREEALLPVVCPSRYAVLPCGIPLPNAPGQDRT